MPSLLKSDKKLKTLLTLCERKEPFNPETLANLLSVKGVSPCQRQLNRCIPLVRNLPEQPGLARLREKMFEHWFKRLTWTPYNFWSNLKRAVRYTGHQDSSIQLIAKRLAPFIREHSATLSENYTYWQSLTTVAANSIHEICIGYPMRNGFYTAKNFGWSTRFLDRLQYQALHTANLSVEQHPYISNPHIPQTLRLYYLNQWLAHDGAVARIPEGWFHTCDTSVKRRRAFASVAAVHGSEVALHYLDEVKPELAALIRVCQSLDLPPAEILTRLKQRRTAAEPEHGCTLPVDFV